MSLSSLKRSTPSAKVRALSVDTFIEEALHYAHGQGVSPSDSSDDFERMLTYCAQINTPPMRRATFTLSEATIAQLSELSAKTGISRSRLIRIWVERAFRSNQVFDLTCDLTP